MMVLENQNNDRKILNIPIKVAKGEPAKSRAVILGAKIDGPAKCRVELSDEDYQALQTSKACADVLREWVNTGRVRAYQHGQGGQAVDVQL